MIDDCREAERIDDVVNTVATLISGKVADALEKSKPKQNLRVIDISSSKTENKPKVKEEAKVVQENSDTPAETQEKKESRELHNALYQSAIDSIKPIYDLDEERKMFSVKGLLNLGNT